jgi:hypothetical protein
VGRDGLSAEISRTLQQADRREDVKKSSQIKSVGATALPERVSAAMSEIAENV